MVNWLRFVWERLTLAWSVLLHGLPVPEPVVVEAPVEPAAVLPGFSASEAPGGATDWFRVVRVESGVEKLLNEGTNGGTAARDFLNGRRPGARLVFYMNGQMRDYWPREGEAS